jgi:hypothetical protein
MQRDIRALLWVSCFAVAFAYVESSVVVYLRAIYYPEGLSFPLKDMTWDHFVVEVAREVATIVMLVSVGVIAGTKSWQRFGYFLVAFGVWDIFYYVWLKTILDWPAAFTDWDVLFLIPVPWVGPMIAPVLVALLMTVLGTAIVARISKGNHFQPTRLSWMLSIGATVTILFSFMSDIDAGLRGQMPSPYRYELLILALAVYGLGFLIACRRPAAGRTSS